MNPSKFLVQFHKDKFPDGKTPVYSKETFFALLEELNK